MYRPSPWLSPVLFIPGLLFEVLVRARNLAYSANLLKACQLDGPVISVGNLTLGGSGKTPLVIYVAQLLSRRGKTPALLSRGYGRQVASESDILSPEVNPSSAPAFSLGDEPALIRRHVPGIWLGISPDRHAAGRRLSELEPGLVFVLDDGFQHRRLRRDLDIVVVDSSQPFLHNRIFPRGSLREPLSGLRRCQAVVLNGASPSPDRDAVERSLRKWVRRGRIFTCTQKIDKLLPFHKWQADPSNEGLHVKCTRAYLVAALGHPDRFFRDVETLGVGVAGTLSLPDHRTPTAAEWMLCREHARRHHAEAIIITEKDAIKIVRPPDFPLLVAVQSTSITEAAAFESMVINSVSGCPKKLSES